MALLDEGSSTVVGQDPVVSGPTPGWRSAWIALATAAVLVASVTYRYTSPVTMDAHEQAESDRELLPPSEGDDEFQLLVAVSAGIDDDLEVGGDVVVVEAPDPSGLSPAERQLLIERIAEDMRTSS